MSVLDRLVRWFVGLLFIFSGLVKLNDPMGTAIKMEEYFEVFSSDISSVFHYLVPFAMEIGLFVVILEILLGVAVLINYRMKFYPYSSFIYLSEEISLNLYLKTRLGIL